MKLHWIRTTETSFDDADYTGRTTGVTALGFRVCLFVGRRYRPRTVEEYVEHADEVRSAAETLGRLHDPKE